jgi:thioredoxin reductase (NADPH)
MLAKSKHFDGVEAKRRMRSPTNRNLRASTKGCHMPKTPNPRRNLHASNGCDQSDAFPLFPDEMIARLSAYGSPEQVVAGTQLFEAGQRNTDMFIIIRGYVRIYARDENNQKVLVAHKRPREFVGELDLITSRSTLADGYAHTDCQLIRIPRRAIRRMLDAEGDIANIVLRAAMLRRTALIKGKVAGVVLLGKPRDADTVRLQQFFERNNYPYRFVQAEGRLTGPSATPCCSIDSMLPAVVLPGGRILYRPDIATLADETGLMEPVDSETIHDVVVVGAGPAGLAAAVYGASEGLSVVVVDGDAPGGQIGTSSRIENYLGFPNGLSGQELANRAQLQAQKFGARIMVSRRVRSIRTSGSVHTLELADASLIRARAVILATGARYAKLAVADYDRFEHQGIHYAATGMEAKLCRGNETVVVGAGNSAGQAAIFLAGYAARVHMLMRGNNLRASMSQYLVNRIENAHNIEVHTCAEVQHLSGQKSLETIGWLDRRSGICLHRTIGTMFVMIGAVPNSDWLDSAVAMDDGGFVATGFHESVYSTSRAGVFAVGDLRSGSVKRVAAAAGEGAAAIGEVHRYLVGLRLAERPYKPQPARFHVPLDHSMVPSVI